MCGRYSLTVNKKQLAEEFGTKEEHFKNFRPRYNIAPQQPVPILVKRSEFRVEWCVWGFIPSWAKDPAIGNQLINARKETLSEKPSFKGPLKNQRCLVLADGFYEWKQEGRIKIPYYIRLKSKKPFGFAGLWSHWMSQEGSEIDSCAIITTESNRLMKSVHYRMPVILAKEKRELWLDPWNHDTDNLLSFLEPYPENEMEVYPVSKLVNDPVHDQAECILEAAELPGI